MTTLLAFSQQTTPNPPPKRRGADRYPLTIIYPAGANIATPEQWRRLDDGRIEVTYHSYEELYWSVTISLWLKEWSTDPGSGELRQAELFHKGKLGAAYEL